MLFGLWFDSCTMGVQYSISTSFFPSNRLKGEVRSLNRCHLLGIRAPAIYFSDLDSGVIVMENLEGSVTARDYIRACVAEGRSDDLEAVAVAIGGLLGRLHAGNIIHGDLTTSNILVENQGDGDKGTENIAMIAQSFTSRPS